MTRQTKLKDPTSAKNRGLVTARLYTGDPRPFAEGLLNGSNGKHTLDAEPVQAPAPPPPAESTLEDFIDEHGVRIIPLKHIRPSALNPRKTFDELELAQLAESIRTKGVLVPIILRLHPASGSAIPTYEIVAGERRFRAAHAAGISGIPAFVRKLSDAQVRELAVIENEQRADVAPLEKADGYAAMIEHDGATVEQIAQRVNKSESTIRQLLRLRNLPDVARQAVEAGTLPPATAGLIARVPGEKLRAKVALHVLANNSWWRETPRIGESIEPMSYRSAKTLIENNCMCELKGAPFLTELVNLTPAGACTTCPKRVGNLAKTDDEYKGIRADVCTDPGCFQEKTEAAAKNAVELAKDRGLTVIPPAAAKNLFHEHHGCELRFGSPYFDLADKCAEDTKRRTFEQLLGKKSADKVQVAIDPQGRARRLMLITDAMPVLRSEHKIGVGQRTVANRPEDLAWKKRQAAERRQQEIGRAAGRVAMQQVAELAEVSFAFLDKQLAGVDRQRLAAIVADVIAHVWHEARQRVAKRREVEDLDQLVSRYAPSELLGLVAELCASREAEHWGRGYCVENDRRGFFKPWDIDPKELIAAAGKQAKEKKAAKKKGGGK